jgi:hypothetical protein
VHAQMTALLIAVSIPKGSPPWPRDGAWATQFPPNPKAPLAASLGVNDGVVNIGLADNLWGSLSGHTARPFEASANLVPRLMSGGLGGPIPPGSRTVSSRSGARAGFRFRS